MKQCLAVICTKRGVCLWQAAEFHQLSLNFLYTGDLLETYGSSLKRSTNIRFFLPGAFSMKTDLEFCGLLRSSKKTPRKRKLSWKKQPRSRRFTGRFHRINNTAISSVFLSGKQAFSLRNFRQVWHTRKWKTESFQWLSLKKRNFQRRSNANLSKNMQKIATEKLKTRIKCWRHMKKRFSEFSE